jgi:hypothetical protein
MFFSGKNFKNLILQKIIILLVTRVVDKEESLSQPACMELWSQPAQTLQSA